MKSISIFHIDQARRTKLTIAIICTILGIMIVTQFNVQRSKESQITSQTSSEIGQIIREMNIEKDTLVNEIQKLSLQLYEYKGLESEQKLSEATFNKGFESLRIASGTEAVKGPGVFVKISDIEKTIASYDLLDLVQELRASGAEAISINGIRITGNSSISGQNKIYIDGIRINAPYNVNAIGMSQTLYQAITMPGGYVTTISSLSGVSIEIKKKSNIIIPSIKI